MRVRHVVAPLLLALLTARSWAQQDVAQQVLQLIHRAGDKELARGRLEISGRSWSGSSTGPRQTVTGKVEVTESGLIRRYFREVRVRETKRLISRLELRAVTGGYEVVEHNGIAPRRLQLTLAPVHLVVDGSWPEAMIPPLLGRNGGHLRAFLASNREVHFASLLPREKGARHLELPGGGVNLRIDGGGAFLSLRVPGDPPILIAKADAALTPAAEPPPGGVKEIDLEVAAGEVRLPARLTLPSDAAGPVPAVVLLADEGARDIDGGLDGVGSGLTAYLAHELARGGYASLRYEKPAPEGGLAPLKDAARAAALLLRSRAETIGGPVAVCGHGEGGLVAGEVARERPELFAAVIGLAAPPRSIDALLRQRLRLQLEAVDAPPERIATRQEELLRELAALSAIQDPADLQPGERLLWDLLKIKPLTTLQKLQVPFLLLYGERDPDVPPEFRAVHRTALALGARVTYKFQVLGAADHEFLQVGLLRPGTDKVFVGVDVDRPRHPALSLFVRDFLDGIMKPEAEKR